MDPDEKIRAAACKVYSHLDYETALHHVSETQLRTLGERALDKKVRVSVLLPRAILLMPTSMLFGMKP